jgi:phenylalanyl-tRNA synthetase beta chain
MKLPLSWLGEFVAIEAGVEELCRGLTMAGLEVENAERIEPCFSGVFAARVLKVERHPDADRLSLCEVDAGSEVGTFSVVCGAPNVTAGMMAPFARVGARLAAAGHGQGNGGLEMAPPLEAAVIRGIRSEGMLCSERELGLSSDHTGILALSSDAVVGSELAGYLHMPDTVLDIAITPNRGDCLSILGLAREIAALFGAKLKMPTLGPVRAGGDGRTADDPALSVAIEVLAPDLCPRYAALRMTGVKIAASPIRVRRRLELCGMRALNNVVDATNYVMLEVGQPLHAFDMERIGEGAIVVRRAGEDREFVTLDDSRRALEPSDLVIADRRKPLAIAGIMGGLNSEVSDSTSNILLESAYFEPMTIARTARRLGLRSEASYRFERGIDRAGQVVALARVARLIRQTAGGREAGPAMDIEPRKVPLREIDFDLDAATAILGVKIAPGDVKGRLKALGASVKSAGRNRLLVTVPSFRADLNETADLAEEVARLRGLDEIPATLPLRSCAAPAPNPRRAFLKTTREVMTGCGLTEVRNIAFIAPADNERFLGPGGGGAVVVSNPLSAELSELRLSLVPGLLAALRFNLNRQAPSFHAFEIGKVFAMRDGVPSEEERLAGVGYGDFALGAVGQPAVGADFWIAKGIIEAYFRSLGIGATARFETEAAQRIPFVHPGRSARITLDGKLSGYVGELHPRESARLELDAPCALFELDLALLLAYGSVARQTIETPPRFPAIRRDVALVLDREVSAGSVAEAFREIPSPLLESVEVFDVYEGETIPRGKKSVALACRYRRKDRTLTDEEANRAHDAVVEQARTRLGAELRR